MFYIVYIIQIRFSWDHFHHSEIYIYIHTILKKNFCKSLLQPSAWFFTVFFFFFFFLNCKFLFLLNSFISHLLIEYMTGSSYTLGTWARGWGCCSDNQKGVSVGTIEQATVERIFEHRVRLLLWDLFHIIPSYARSKQSMSSLFHLEIR
jgi:hypothetical protein